MQRHIGIRSDAQSLARLIHGGYVQFRRLSFSFPLLSYAGWIKYQVTRANDDAQLFRHILRVNIVFDKVMLTSIPQ